MKQFNGFSTPLILLIVALVGGAIYFGYPHLKSISGSEKTFQGDTFSFQYPGDYLNNKLVDKQTDLTTGLTLVASLISDPSTSSNGQSLNSIQVKENKNVKITDENTDLYDYLLKQNITNATQTTLDIGGEKAVEFTRTDKPNVIYLDILHTDNVYEFLLTGSKAAKNAETVAKSLKFSN